MRNRACEFARWWTRAAREARRETACGHAAACQPTTARAPARSPHLPPHYCPLERLKRGRHCPRLRAIWKASVTLPVAIDPLLTSCTSIGPQNVCPPIVKLQVFRVGPALPAQQVPVASAGLPCSARFAGARTAEVRAAPSATAPEPRRPREGGRVALFPAERAKQGRRARPASARLRVFRWRRSKTRSWRISGPFRVGPSRPVFAGCGTAARSAGVGISGGLWARIPPSAEVILLVLVRRGHSSALGAWVAIGSRRA